MSDDKSKINRVRLICEFIKLTSFDSESFNEEKISEYLKEKLKELGLKVESDTASEILKKISTGTSHPASNIYATLKGNKAGPPVLFSPSGPQDRRPAGARPCGMPRMPRDAVLRRSSVAALCSLALSPLGASSAETLP